VTARSRVARTPSNVARWLTVGDVTVECDVNGALGVVVELLEVGPSRSGVERLRFTVNTDEALRLGVLLTARAAELARTLAAR
jgi:hypothetical protein